MTSPVGTSNGDGNGRVTLAVLGSKMDDLTETVRDLVKMVHTDHDKLTTVCTKFEEIDTLKKAIIGNVIAVVVAISGAVWALLKQ